MTPQRLKEPSVEGILSLADNEATHTSPKKPDDNLPLKYEDLIDIMTDLEICKRKDPKGAIVLL